jgi:hypothetical protein
MEIFNEKTEDDKDGRPYPPLSNIKLYIRMKKIHWDFSSFGI